MDVTASDDLIVSSTLDYYKGSNNDASNNTDGYNDERNPVIIAGTLIGIFIITCNLFTLITIKCSRLAREHYAKLVASLCVADFLTGCDVIFITFGPWLLDHFNDSCPFWGAFRDGIQQVVIFVSQLHTVSMTTDRFLAVRYPLRYTQLMTPKLLWCLIIIPWVLGFIEAFFQLGFVIGVDCTVSYYEILKENSTLLICRPLVHMTIVTVANGIMYMMIWRDARKQRQRIHQQHQQQQQQQQQPKLDKASRMILIVVFLSYILWLPFTVFELIRLARRTELSSLESIIRIMFVFLGLTNCFINNMIYGIYNKEFRAAYKQIMCYWKERINVAHWCLWKLQTFVWRLQRFFFDMLYSSAIWQKDYAPSVWPNQGWNSWLPETLVLT